MNPARRLVVEELEIEVTRKNIRHIYLRVLPPDGLARISAPRHVDDASLRRFIADRLDWIRRHREAIRARTPQQTPEFNDGDTLSLLGAERRLKISFTPGPRRVVEHEDVLELRVRPDDDTAVRARVYERFLRARLKREIARLLTLWCPRLGVAPPLCSLRLMRTRWGSCSPTLGRMRLNPRLAEKPLRCLEYVLVHELAHLREPGHGARFKALMDGLLPPWRALRAELNGKVGDQFEPAP